jgi:hypothetical protein
LWLTWCLLLYVLHVWLWRATAENAEQDALLRMRKKRQTKASVHSLQGDIHTHARTYTHSDAARTRVVQYDILVSQAATAC